MVGGAALSSDSSGLVADGVDLARQLRDTAERWITRIVLGNGHVSALHSLDQNVHDLWSNLYNLGVLALLAQSDRRA